MLAACIEVLFDMYTSYRTVTTPYFWCDITIVLWGASGEIVDRSANSLCLRRGILWARDPHVHMLTYELVGAGAGCILRVYGFLAFSVILLSALNSCPWLSSYFWHRFRPTCECKQIDMNCSLKPFLTFRRRCASVV